MQSDLSSPVIVRLLQVQNLTGAFTSRYDRRVAVAGAALDDLAELVTLLRLPPCCAAFDSRLRLLQGEAAVMAMICCSSVRIDGPAALFERRCVARQVMRRALVLAHSFCASLQEREGCRRLRAAARQPALRARVRSRQQGARPLLLL